MQTTKRLSSPPATPGAAVEGVGRRDHLAAAGLIGSHALHHVYSHAFYVVLPSIYTALGLTPFTAGLLGSIRGMGFGLASTAGGVLVDRIPHWRLLVLYLSLAAMGLGYLLAGLTSTYVLLMMAILLTSVAGSIWHPASRSLLSQIYSHRRGFIVSIDRSAGDVGDTAGPLLTGALLLAFAWKEIFIAAFPVALLGCLVLWLLLRQAGIFQELGAGTLAAPRPLAQQMREMWELVRGSGKVLLLLVAVKSVTGFGQGGLLLFIPLYLQETVGMESLGIGFHVALLTGLGIVTNPLFGMLSDRIGRRPVVLVVLSAKVTVATLLALMGEGIALTVLLAIIGAFLHAVDPLIQAWGLDVAHGRNLEGTVLGTLYGANFLLRGIAPLILGGIIAAFGFSALFWYVAAMNAAALVLVGASLPFLKRDSGAAAR